jgi:thioredoxin reductase
MEARVRKTKYNSMNHDTVLGDEQVVTGVKALNKKNYSFEIPATGFFVAIGLNQILIFLKDLCS